MKGMRSAPRSRAGRPERHRRASRILALGAFLLTIYIYLRAQVTLIALYAYDIVFRAFCLTPQMRARLSTHVIVAAVLFWGLDRLFRLGSTVSSPSLIKFLSLAIVLNITALAVVVVSLIYTAVKPPPTLNFDVGCNDPTLATLERVGRLALERANECDPEACADAGNNSGDEDFPDEEDFPIEGLI